MRKNEKQKGFTLVEVMVATLILGIGIIASLGMVEAGRTGVNSGRATSDAAVLAKDKMEGMLAVSYQDLVNGSTTGEENMNGYARRWHVEKNSPREDLSRIRVIVEWKNSRGTPHRFELATLIAEGVLP